MKFWGSCLLWYFTIIYVVYYEWAHKNLYTITVGEYNLLFGFFLGLF
jgi:hypothetical protein